MILINCRIWQKFLVILVFYTAWVCPFEFGFLSEDMLPAWHPLAVIDNVLNAFFLVDIMLTFFVAYFEKSTYTLVVEPRRIAWRYLKSWFLFDFISTIPTQLVRLIMGNNFTYGFLNLLRLWRLYRVSAMFARLVFTLHHYLHSLVLAN